MNTKLILISSSFFMRILGIILTFAPDWVISYLDLELTKISLFQMQILGALYFGFSMLNWTSKGAIIGGIYNRPIAIANFSHFLIAGLALLKGVISNPGIPIIFWVLTFIYAIFALVFGIGLFTHPLEEKSK